MRILYIVTAFPRHSGDVITPWLIATIEELRARSVEVEVLAPSYRGLADQFYDGIPVHRFRYAPARWEALTHDQTTPDRLRERPLYSALLPGYLLSGSIAAARLARSGRFDLVHAFWPLPHGLFGLAARRFSGVPLVSTFFGVELTWVRKQLPFLAPLVRAIIRRSDAVTVISRHTAAEVHALAPGIAVRTIPFGAAIDPLEVSPSPIPRPIEGGFHLLFVGRLVERKGVSVLLQALARLRTKGEDFTLTVAGDGPLRSALEGEANSLGVGSAVHFTGFIAAAALAELYRSSDLFVLPAVRDSKGDVEGLGVVLIEALLRGLPVVASDSGGISDVVEDGVGGLLVAPGDVDALAGAIRRLSGDRQLAARLAAQGRERVLERFSWAHITGELIDLYQEVAGATDRSGGAQGASAPPRS